MPGSWIQERRTKGGKKRYRVLFRTGGRESKPRHAGAFRTMREAVLRQAWIDGELAAHRVPELELSVTVERVPTLIEAARRWQASRLDVADSTATYHVSALNRASALHERRLDTISGADIAELVGELAAAGRARETIRKTVTVLAMIFEHEGLEPNPARDRRVRLPREDRPELNPPTAEHVAAVHAILPPRYRLPLLVLDATGMRVGELEGLTWGDVDEARGRWRVSRAVSKTSRARWISVSPAIFEAVLALCPRDDRTAERPVFQGFGADRFRTAVTRACVAAGVPTFSPHDLRHRRISLLHLAGVPWARIGEAVGQRNISVTADTYTHVLIDEAELDYETLTR